MSTFSAITILHVALDKPLRHCFDYLLPADMRENQKLLPGMRLLVPFGRKHEVGILLKVDEHPCFPIDKLKSAIAILDEEPFFSEEMMTLYEKASQYYHFPIGEIVLGTMPVLFRTEQKKTQRKSKKSESDHEKTSPQKTYQEMQANMPTLNAEQSTAVQAVINSSGFQTFLLEGVTGSGKTEVYMQVISHYLAQGKQALVLVPEIGLTPQTIARFESRFPYPIVNLHSRLTDKERQNAWLSAKKGEAKIVIGTRSAIFTPIAHLGVIVMDEEHDHSFKQQSGFRYSARDLIVWRGYIQEIPVLLGTATPSLESLHNAKTGRFQWLHLPERAGNASHPSFHLIDLRNQPLEEGLSSQLLHVMDQHLTQGNQVLLFLNRRGFAPTLMCHSCGWSAACKRCDAKLTVHQQPVRLMCHHCNAIYKIPPSCEQCQNAPLILFGFGTQRLEEALQKHFPNTPIIRIDRDSVRHKGALETKLKEVQNGERQILIGTQMLAKGHHFPNVTLVGIINSDAGFYSSDFRSSEQMGQLIMQVAGRAGRAEKPGQVYIQTHHPQHPLLQSLIQDGYREFAEHLLQERNEAKWPPFSTLALLRAEATSQNEPMRFLNQASDLAKKSTNGLIQILGPIPSPMERKAGHFRALLLFQAPQRPVLQRWLPVYVKALEKMKLGKYVRWSLDVDPLEIF